MHLYQTNNNHGWMWMGLYWSIGMLVGVYFGYLPTWEADSVRPLLSPEHIGAMAITIGVMPRFFDRYTNFGRSSSIVASMIMAILNGLCETMIFLAVYDFGAVWLDGILVSSSGGYYNGSNTVISSMLGFTAFNIYSGRIHISFWLPRGFPRHTKPDAKPFHVQGLPEVTLMSISWLVLYVSRQDIAFICVLHFLFNFHGAMAMGLQLPFIIGNQKKKRKLETKRNLKN